MKIKSYQINQSSWKIGDIIAMKGTSRQFAIVDAENNIIDLQELSTEEKVKDEFVMARFVC